MADTRGIFGKFHVQRTDGTDQPGGRHEDCFYFVLDLTHDEAARSILPALADAYDANDRPTLAADLRRLVGLSDAG